MVRSIKHYHGAGKQGCLCLARSPTHFAWVLVCIVVGGHPAGGPAEVWVTPEIITTEEVSITHQGICFVQAHHWMGGCLALYKTPVPSGMVHGVFSSSLAFHSSRHSVILSPFYHTLPPLPLYHTLPQSLLPLHSFSTFATFPSSSLCIFSYTHLVHKYPFHLSISEPHLSDHSDTLTFRCQLLTLHTYMFEEKRKTSLSTASTFLFLLLP